MWCKTPGASRRANLGMLSLIAQAAANVNLLSYRRPYSLSRKREKRPALKDNDPQVRAAAIDAIGKIKDRDAVDPLIRCLNDREVIIRIGAAEVLGKLGDRRVRGPLKALEDDPSSEVREAMEMALKRIQVKN